MEPEYHKLSGGPSESILHPIVLVAMFLAIVLIFSLRRKSVITPVLCMVFLVPLGQEFVFGGMHLLVLRVIILAGLIRMQFSKRSVGMYLFASGFNALDKVFVCWTFIHVITFLILFSFRMEALVNRVAFIWDTLGGYFLLRFLIQDREDIERVIKLLAFIAIVIAAGMLNEHLRMQNVFGILGGVPPVPGIRGGHIRAQGPFTHPLLAGSFGATVLPLFLLLWQSGKARFAAGAGMVSATAMAMMAGSSTPLLAYGAGIFAACMWPLRKNMRLIRWGIVFALVGLQIVMKAPVWFLITHLMVVDASSGYHRAMLVDQFIRNFRDWWLIGTNGNGNWGWDMWDTANQYVKEGENAGLGAFVCFLALISISFSRIGKAIKALGNDRMEQWFLWSLGATLFAHVTAFFGIGYFDQSQIGWYGLLAMITAATAPFVAKKVQSAEAEVPPLFLRPALSSISAPISKHQEFMPNPKNRVKV